MDNKKNHIIFYCADIRHSDFSKLESEGASGTISSMLWIAEGLARSKHKVTIVNETSNAHPHLERDVQFLGLKNSNSKHLLNESPLPKIIICVGVEYSHTFTSIINLTAAKVWFWHHNPIRTDSFFKTLREKDIEKHIFVSLNHALRHIKINASKILYFYKKITIIYNPLDLTLLSNHLTSSLSKPKNHKKIKCAYIGNTSLEKGYNEFIELKNRIASTAPWTFEWHVFGGGLYNPERFSTDRQAKVFTHGTIGRSDLYKKINEFDFIACGLGGNETFCVTAIESAFLGKKILTSNKGGQIEALSNFKSKYNIKTIKSAHQLIHVHNISISEWQLEDFRKTCHRKYSIESSVGNWELLIEGNRPNPYFIGNLRGAIESMGLFR